MRAYQKGKCGKKCNIPKKLKSNAKFDCETKEEEESDRLEGKKDRLGSLHKADENNLRQARGLFRHRTMNERRSYEDPIYPFSLGRNCQDTSYRKLLWEKV